MTNAEMVLLEIAKEYKRATDIYPPMNSAHEGFAVLKEEVDELWNEIKRKDQERSRESMRQEAIQVAAMAVRFIVDVVDPFCAFEVHHV